MGDMTLIGVRKFLDEKTIHLVFEWSLWLKGAFALSEIVSGVATYFIPQHLLLKLVLWVTKDEFVEDPHDLVANFLLHTAQHLSFGAKEFAAVYLLGHGVIKLWLIVGLLRKKLWYYPISGVVFGAFIAYQIYRYTFTHSIWLLLITALDIAVLALTWHEYRFLRSKRSVAMECSQ